jgi:putative SOS response-associated peptidase YedK
MCGRYTLTASPELVARHFGLAAPVALAPRYNAAPGQEVATIRVAAPGGVRELELRRWGLVPPWAPDARHGARLINARSETAAERPAFREAFRRRRCLVPADGFYEWDARCAPRQPYHVALESGAPFGIAGLYERWLGPGGEVVESVALLTAAACERLRRLHPRMPAILDPSAWPAWLDPACHEPAALLPLLAPAPDAAIRLRPVGLLVNDVRNDDPRCLAPAAPAPVQESLF